MEVFATIISQKPCRLLLMLDSKKMILQNKSGIPSHICPIKPPERLYSSLWFYPSPSVAERSRSAGRLGGALFLAVQLFNLRLGNFNCFVQLVLEHFFRRKQCEIFSYTDIALVKLHQLHMLFILARAQD